MEVAYERQPEGEQDASRKVVKRSRHDHAGRSSTESSPVYQGGPALRLGDVQTHKSQRPAARAPATRTPATPRPRTPHAPSTTPTPGAAPRVSGVLTAQDNFSGRSTTQFGIGEVINLSFTSSPARTAAALGGLTWVIVSGGGTLTGADGVGTYTARLAAGRVSLRLQVGPTPGVGPTYSIRIVAPSGAYMTRTSSIRHTHNLCGVGFRGFGFYLPKNVSFINVLMREGSVAGAGRGFYSRHDGLNHATGPWARVTAGNAATGCRDLVPDTVDTGDDGPPFAEGRFLWAIPWQYQGEAGAAIPFFTANHLMRATRRGRATISKAGAGPFSRAAGDSTSSY